MDATLATSIRAVLNLADARQIPHEQWMQCYTAIASACAAGRPQAVYELLQRELSTAVNAVLVNRLKGLVDAELLARYTSEYDRFLSILDMLHGLFGYMNRMWAGTHGQRGVAPRPGVHDTTALGLLTWRNNLVEPLSPALNGAMLDALDAERDTWPIGRVDGPEAAEEGIAARLTPLSIVLVGLNALGVAADRVTAPPPMREFAPRGSVALRGCGVSGSFGAAWTGSAAMADGGFSDEDDDRDDADVPALRGPTRDPLQ